MADYRSAINAAIANMKVTTNWMSEDVGATLNAIDPDGKGARNSAKESRNAAKEKLVSNLKAAREASAAAAAAEAAKQPAPQAPVIGNADPWELQKLFRLIDMSSKSAEEQQKRAYLMLELSKKTGKLPGESDNTIDPANIPFLRAFIEKKRKELQEQISNKLIPRSVKDKANISLLVFNYALTTLNAQPQSGGDGENSTNILPLNILTKNITVNSLKKNFPEQIEFINSYITQEPQAPNTQASSSRKNNQQAEVPLLNPPESSSNNSRKNTGREPQTPNTPPAPSANNAKKNTNITEEERNTYLAESEKELEETGKRLENTPNVAKLPNLPNNISNEAQNKLAAEAKLQANKAGNLLPGAVAEEKVNSGETSKNIRNKLREGVGSVQQEYKPKLSSNNIQKRVSGFGRSAKVITPEERLKLLKAKRTTKGGRRLATSRRRSRFRCSTTRKPLARRFRRTTRRAH